jgi:hypothetical protein
MEVSSVAAWPQHIDARRCDGVVHEDLARRERRVSLRGSRYPVRDGELCPARATGSSVTTAACRGVQL